jgi:hypothetical protein
MHELIINYIDEMIETRMKEPTSDTELELHESPAHKG